MPTPEQRFSAWLRPQLTAPSCNARVTQIVDAAVPGPSDLLLEWTGRYVWLELKVRALPRSEEVSRDQVLFLRNRWALNKNSFLLLQHLNLDGSLMRLMLWKGCDVTAPLSDELCCAAWSDFTPTNMRKFLKWLHLGAGHTLPAGVEPVSP
jgi:hypothetical protein